VGRKRTKKQLLSTTTVCLLSEAKRRKRRSCWATNWITRRQQHNISNIIRQVQCEDEAEFRGIFRMDITSFESLFELMKFLNLGRHHRYIGPVRTGSVPALDCQKTVGCAG